MLFTLWSFQTN